MVSGSKKDTWQLVGLWFIIGMAALINANAYKQIFNRFKNLTGKSRKFVSHTAFQLMHLE
jgi:hypothetical protein